MSEKRYILPKTAQRAFLAAMPPDWFNCDPEGHILAPAFEALAKSLSENPIAPTEEQAQYMYDCKNGLGHAATVQYCMAEWQRRMFLAPETRVPEEIKDLLWDAVPKPTEHQDASDLHNTQLLAAFLRGQQSKERR